MSESKRKIVLGVFLLVALIWGYSNEPWKNKTKSPGQPKSATTAGASSSPRDKDAASAQSVAKPLTKPVTDAELALIRKADWGADPFVSGSPVQQKQRVATVTKHRPVYRLKGIIYNKTSPTAFLNNQAVREGDTIDGATVMKIKRRSVTLKRGSDIFTVKVS